MAAPDARGELEGAPRTLGIDLDDHVATAEKIDALLIDPAAPRATRRADIDWA